MLLWIVSGTSASDTNVDTQEIEVDRPVVNGMPSSTKKNKAVADPEPNRKWKKRPEMFMLPEYKFPTGI